MKFSEIKPAESQSQKKKRRGRGNAAGTGTYSGRGMKGQNARSGGKRRPGFEGGQTPLYRKMPKLKGFKNINRKEYHAINLDTLNETFEAKDKVTKKTLAEKGLIKESELVKILGRGKLEKALEIEAEKASKSAQKAIEKAGGSFTSLLKEEQVEAPKKPKKKTKKEESEEE